MLSHILPDRKVTLLVASAAIALPAALMAATEADRNDDGMLNLLELQAAHPEISEETFKKLDVNADGLLDADEITVAREDGLLPPAPKTGS
ncbi:EF-hand domain-containing protein [Pseudodonghicola flavimaris]|uniref:EF-hand domain-containing protein n=1 Tax=Pseudodonghicola flavimaris TaxID=3050036 RepID=A0ABT7EVT1_9RHOB|nr:hypothetical protein [Pseudodonghicola flavimaris]MDK3016452.1 hypothetical protein [Pseudodonghicola flavimaris]